MRYYSISIDKAPGVFKPAEGASIPGALWDTWINGVNDFGAQQIEFSIEMQETAAPTNNSQIVIKGVSWDQIKETNNLINKGILMHAGMKPGLPLATAQSQHYTELFRGIILRAWGNWEGTEMSIGLQVASGKAAEKSADSGGGKGGSQLAGLAESLIGSFGGGGGGSAAAVIARHNYLRNVDKLRFQRTGPRSIDGRPFSRGPVSQSPGVQPLDTGGNGGTSAGFDMSGTGISSPQVGGDFFGGGTPGLTDPLNLIHNMMPNMPMSSAVQQMLSKAFPGANIITNIHPGLKLPHQDAGMYQSMSQVMPFLKNLSQSILGAKNYTGVRAASYGDTVHVFDGTQPPINSGLIQVIDIIGQPTWIDQQRIHLKTVLRADLHIGDRFTLPSNILMALSPEANVLGANGAASPQRSHVTVEGMVFRIYKILHVGDFRSPHGSDWSSNYEAQVEGEGGTTPPGADSGASVNSSSQQQNPNNQPTSEEPPAVPSQIPGVTVPPSIDTTPQKLGISPPFKKDIPQNVSFGSKYTRKTRHY
jgi:hypothetical protein